MDSPTAKSCTRDEFKLKNLFLEYDRPRDFTTFQVSDRDSYPFSLLSNIATVSSPDVCIQLCVMSFCHIKVLIIHTLLIK